MDKLREKFDYKKALEFLNKATKYFARFSIPILLSLLILLPAIIEVIRSRSNDTFVEEPVPIEFGDLKKTIRSTATVDYDYSYDVRSYQSAVITNMYVEDGSEVSSGTLLASLDPIAGTTLRLSDIDAQIASTQKELDNLNLSKNDALNIDSATTNQIDVQIANLEDQISKLENDIDQEKKDNDAEIIKLKKEIDDLQEEYDDLKAKTNINDTISQYEAEIDGKEAQINSLESSLVSLNSSYTAQLSVVTALESSCTDPLDSCQNELNAARGLLSSISNQLSSVNSQINSLENEIDDLQDEIDALKELDEYDPDSDYPYSDQINSGNYQSELADLLGDINKKEAELDILEDSPTIDGMEDSLDQLNYRKDELLATSQLTDSNLNQSLSSIDQRIASAEVQLNNLYVKRNDFSQDIAEQTETKVFTARRDGLIANIQYEIGDEVPMNANVMKIVSKDKVLTFTISAENRELIREGMKISFPSIDNEVLLEISKISVAPITSSSLTGSSLVEYEVEINLNSIDQENWVVGSEIDIDIILDEKNSAIYVPATSVFENKIVVGKGKSGDKFSEIEVVNVEVGLTTGRYTEILNLNNYEDIYVFPFYPRDDESYNLILEKFQ